MICWRLLVNFQNFFCTIFYVIHFLIQFLVKVGQHSEFIEFLFWFYEKLNVLCTIILSLPASKFDVTLFMH